MSQQASSLKKKKKKKKKKNTYASRMAIPTLPTDCRSPATGSKPTTAT
jgi:hypothetical protein